jgi:hypothetical protein
MATIFRSRRAGAPEDAYGDGATNCSFCESPHVTAYWCSPVERIAVCRTCCLEVLPALLADGLLGEHGDSPNAIGNLLHFFETFQKFFWRAAAIAVHRCAGLKRTEVLSEGPISSCKDC